MPLSHSVYRFRLVICVGFLTLISCSAVNEGVSQKTQRDVVEAAAQDPFFAEFHADSPPANSVLTCPTWPGTNDAILVPEALSNYQLLAGNTGDFDAIGLMAVNSWHSDCYGDITPGTSFLFPGSTNANATWTGTNPSINCVSQAPMVLPANASPDELHEQMATLLGRCTRDFVGFSVKLANNGPVFIPRSAACNNRWFGNKNLTTCNNDDWLARVDDMVKAGLSSDDCTVSLSSGKSMTKELVMCAEVTIQAIGVGTKLIIKKVIADKLNIISSGSPNLTIDSIEATTVNAKADYSAHLYLKNIKTPSLTVETNYNATATLGTVSCKSALLDASFSSTIALDDTFTCSNTVTIRSGHYIPGLNQAATVDIKKVLNSPAAAVSAKSGSTVQFTGKANLTDMTIDVDYSGTMAISGGTITNVKGKVDHASTVNNDASVTNLSVTVDGSHSAPYCPILGLGSSYTINNTCPNTSK